MNANRQQNYSLINKIYANQNGQINYNNLTIPKKRTPENSIILAKRYRGSQSSLGTTNSRTSSSNHSVILPPEGYIQEHYSPQLTRKLIQKTNSVDIVNTKQTLEERERLANNVFYNNNNFRAKSNSPTHPLIVNKKVQFSDSNEPKKPSTVIKRFFNKFNSNNKNGNEEEKSCSTEYNQIKKQPSPSSYYQQPAKESPLTLTSNNRKPSENVIVVANSVKNSDKVNKRERKLKASPPPEDKITLIKRNFIAESAETENSNVNSDNATNRFSLLEDVNNTGCCARFIANMIGTGLKLKERLVVGACIAVVFFTLILVIDVQMDFGMSGHHLVPSHGKVRYVKDEDGPGSAYNSFRKRFLQKTHRYVS